MKKGVILLGLIFSAILTGGVLFLTNPLVDVAEECLTLLSQNRIHEATQLHAEGIRADSVNKAKFEAVYRDSILTKYKSASWHHRKVEGDWGLLEGVMETSEAGYPEIYLEIQFIKENGEWKIVGLRYSPVEY